MVLCDSRDREVEQKEVQVSGETETQLTCTFSMRSPEATAESRRVVSEQSIGSSTEEVRLELSKDVAS